MSLLTRRQLLFGAAAAAGIGACGAHHSTTAVPPLVEAQPAIDGLKLVNWYPWNDGWERLWSSAHLSDITRDFAEIAAAGANAVRVIVSTYAFGYPDPAPGMKDKLAQIVAAAAGHGLRVQLTLFDFFSAYGDLSGSTHWLGETLGSYTDDPRLCFVELQNELDPTDPTALRWARTLYPLAKRASGATPVTISVTSTAGPDALESWVRFAAGMGGMDLFDLHYYGAKDRAAAEIAAFKYLCGSVPLFIGETGMSSRPNGAPASPNLEKDQAQYLQAVIDACHANDLPLPAPWIWRDFTSLALPDVGYDPAGLYFGLLRTDGSPKPAFNLLRDAYATLA